MHPAPPAALELALRLRYLRTELWADSKLTQAALAKALGKAVGKDQGLSPADRRVVGKQDRTEAAAAREP